MEVDVITRFSETSPSAIVPSTVRVYVPGAVSSIVCYQFVVDVSRVKTTFPHGLTAPVSISTYVLGKLHCTVAVEP